MAFNLDKLFGIFGKAREVRRVFRTAERLAENFKEIEKANLQQKLRDIIAQDSSMKPLQDAINRAQRLVKRIEALSDDDD